MHDLALIAIDPRSANNLTASPAQIGSIPIHNLLPKGTFNKMLEDFFVQKDKPGFIFENSIFPQSWLQESLQNLTQIDHFGYGISSNSLEPYAVDHPEISNENECIENRKYDSRFVWNGDRNICTFVTVISKKDNGDLGKLQSLKLYLAGISNDGLAAMMLPVNNDSGTCSGDSGGPQFISGQSSPIIIGILSRGPYGNIPYCKGTPKIIELLEPNLKLLSRFVRELMDAPN